MAFVCRQILMELWGPHTQNAKKLKKKLMLKVFYCLGGIFSLRQYNTTNIEPKETGIQPKKTIKNHKNPILKCRWPTANIILRGPVWAGMRSQMETKHRSSGNSYQRLSSLKFKIYGLVWLVQYYTKNRVWKSINLFHPFWLSAIHNSMPLFFFIRVYNFAKIQRIIVYIKSHRINRYRRGFEFIKPSSISVSVQMSDYPLFIQM